MDSDKRNLLSELLGKVVDGRVTDENIEHLEQLLDGDDLAKEYYLNYINVHCQLENSSESKTELDLGLAKDGRNIINFAAVRGREKKLINRFLIPLAVACLAMFAFIIISNLDKAEPGETPEIASYKVDKVYAVVANVENAQWDIPGIAPVSGVQLGLGLVNLTKGKLRLDFNNGEEITIAAPARFEIKDTNLLIMSHGQLVAHIPESGVGFTVITPNGAVVDLGTEFAINVNQHGKNQVKVLKGAVIASSTDENGNTSWGEELLEGDEANIVKAAPLEKITNQSQSYIKPLGVIIPSLFINDAYDRAIKESSPIGYWKFDKVTDQGLIENEMGGQPLKLSLQAKIARTEHGGRLEVGKKNELNTIAQGYAMSTESIPGLNTEKGCSLEFWAYSSAMDWQTLTALSMNNIKFERPSHIRHDPHFILLERAGLAGSKRSHIHPSLSMRAAYRIEPSYDAQLGKNNSYTTDSYLIHRWFHVAIVKKLDGLQIYINGKLSAESVLPDVVSDLECDLIIGRMKPGVNSNDSRQWIGAIDEAALYNRALSAKEILKHYDAVVQKKN